MPVYPGDPPVTFAVVRSHSADGYQVTHLSLGSHTGTHLDAPRHLFPSAATLDQYGLGQLVGPGVIIDCRLQRSIQDSPAIINKATLSERLAAHALPAGGFLLLWTEGALITLEAGRLLLDAGPALIGTDAPSLDDEPYPVHRLLLEHNVLLAENLCRLEQLGPGPVTCAFLPLPIVGTDAAPVRAVAWR